jgi:MoaA/NifB/PqqE/SkfB family radical SAM enzyme
MLHDRHIQTAVITNGTKIKVCDSIGKLDYLGISVDSACGETWAKVKGVINESMFDDVISNILSVRNEFPHLDITYKFLLLPTNYTEVYDAIELSKRIGCNNFHLRPAAMPWFNADKSFHFSEAIRENVSTQIDAGRIIYEDENFRIYGVVVKFSDTWTVEQKFSKCYAAMTTCFIAPDGTVGLCCDRRGDDNFTIKDLQSTDEILKFWGFL